MKSRGSDPGAELQSLMRHLRDTLTDAITSGQSGLVEELLGHYRELVTTFLDKLAEVGGNYDWDQAVEELRSIGGGWSEMNWVERDLRNAIEDAVSASNRSVLLDVIYEPVGLARRAFHYRDSFVFTMFIRLVPFTYFATTLQPSPDRRQLIVDRCVMYLRELLDLVIHSEMDRASEGSDVKTIGGFAKEVLVQFNRLLKLSYDERNLIDFGSFVDALRRVEPVWLVGEHEVERLRRQLSEPGPAAAADVKSRYDVAVAKREVHDDLAQLGSVILFGLHAWIVADVSRGRLAPEEAPSWREPLNEIEDLPSLWRLFESARSENWGDTLEWTNWELDIKPSGEVHTIEVRSFLELSFLLLALRILARQRGEQALPPDTQSLSYLAAEGGPFLQHLDLVEASSDKWVKVIGEPSLQQLDTLRRLLRQGAAAELARRRDDVIRAPLNRTKIEHIYEGLAKTWRKEALLRNLVVSAGAYEDGVSESAEALLPVFGINTLDLKEIYISESSILSGDHGELFGRHIADGENQQAISVLLTGLPDREVTEVDLIERETEAVFKELGKSDDLILLLVNSWDAETALTDPETRIRADSGTGRPTGLFQEVPLYSLHHPSKMSAVIVVKVSSACRWKQYHPPRLSTTQLIIDNAIAFDVSTFTEDTAEQQIRLWNERGVETRFSAADLLERVNLRALERFEFEVVKPEHGYILRLPGL